MGGMGEGARAGVGGSLAFPHPPGLPARGAEGKEGLT